ncbi:MAG: hypothetical protein LBM78_01755 [Clostridiales bacterium]|jgi:hypothetical protein|nr:hypothetical protein [Clostridiales bacterium]
MSGKKNSGVNEFLAFWGIILAAVAIVISQAIGWAGGNGRVAGIISLISTIFLLISVIFAAIEHLGGKSFLLKILFWVAVIVIIVFGVLGVAL